MTFLGFEAKAKLPFEGRNLGLDLKGSCHVLCVLSCLTKPVPVHHLQSVIIFSTLGHPGACWFVIACYIILYRTEITFQKSLSS